MIRIYSSSTVFKCTTGLLPRSAVAQLHNTSTQGDFFSWFKNKKEQQVKPTEATKDTKELIKDIESGKKSTVIQKEKLELKPENFIGEDPIRLERKARKALVDEIPFNKWMNPSKVKDEAQLNSLSVGCFNDVFPENKVSSVDDVLFGKTFPDLKSKFEFTKALQARTGYLIPDIKLTTLNSAAEFTNYFVREIISGKLSKFKESEPNAIDLSARSFASPNVYVAPDVNTQSQKRKLGKIMHEVQSLEAARIEEAIEQARRS